jgi:mannitol/fructose-specific phosphotransferase system IIA component (Ntr-type)
MAFIDLVSTDVVKVPLTSRDKSGVIEELVQVLVDAGKVANREDVLAAIHKRETMGSTGLEFGIAVPHAKTEAVKEIIMSIGIAPQGIEFYAIDGKPSTLFFMILAAPDQSGPHIEALAEIAKLSKSRAVLKALIAATSAEEVVEIFRVD